MSSFPCLGNVKLNDLFQTCQTNDWSSHKAECAALQHWAATAPSPDVSVPNDAVRCIGRILWSLRKKGTNSKWVSKIARHTMSDLMGEQAAELNTLQSRGFSLQALTVATF